MELKERVDAFASLGKKIRGLSQENLLKLFENANLENKWFTQDNVDASLKGIVKFLDKGILNDWVHQYDLGHSRNTQVGIIMAGNIPMVGFHDFLAVLLAGLKVAIKPSSDDTYLIKTLVSWINDIEPRFKNRIEFPESLKDVDAVIATGSDNSARYFEYYFGKKPNIIRKNRTSVAVLDGTESTKQVKKLGKDIFTYFGLGCRNVSKIFYPSGYDIRSIFPDFEEFSGIIHHHKYRNNYDYNKSILLVNKEPHLDTGFLLTKEDENLVSPISVVFIESYESTSALKQKIEGISEKIQCVVTEKADFQDLPNQVNFGETQLPLVTDYADGVDTLAFLSKFN